MSAFETSLGAHPPDFQRLRHEMVNKQLRARGISDCNVLAAMDRVPREAFVPEAFRNAAYEDRPLSIGYGQTISQPLTVALQCQALQLTGDERVLEIGAGSGYSAAVLSLQAKIVYTVERIALLASLARATLRRLSYHNVHVTTGDGTEGLPHYQPYDAIIVTAGGKTLPQPYLEQLAIGGRIVIPLGGTLDRQFMYRFTKQPDGITTENLGPFAFVPLIGRHGWPPENGSRYHDPRA